MMANLVSMVTSGVFDEFPTLKYALIEGGIAWAPAVMGRLDRLYPALKAELPWLTRRPSDYILEHCSFSTQPIEEPDEPGALLDILAMVQAERTVIFASDYPHWDFDNPLVALAPLPPALRRRIMVDNALDLYGERLLAPAG
jgi:predicted TIM-barrel fold metal-dependent hydrolase